MDPASSDMGGEATGEHLADELCEAYLGDNEDDGGDELQRLSRERDFWKHMFNQLVAEYPEGILITAADGTVTHWNERFSDHMKMARSDALGEDASDVFSTAEESETLPEAVVRTGDTVEEEEPHDVPTDSLCQYHGVPLRAPTGDVVGSFGVVPDISEKVKNQRELHDLHETVSINVGEHLSELSESIDKVGSFAEETEPFAGKEIERMEGFADKVSNQSATIEEIASSAEEVSQASQRAQDRATEGEQTAETAIDRMGAVQESAERVNDTIDGLTSQADEMSEIIDAINDIADQTNMLALNASIEAARAGEKGEGFAVVADEVKSLAEESQERADEIEQMIVEMVETTDQTADRIGQTTTEIEEAITAVRETLDSLQEIRNAVDETATGVKEVAGARDHAASTEQVAATTDEAVDKLTELEDRLDNLSQIASEQHDRVAEIEDMVDELVE
uniref:Soluble transducer protein HtH n=1 Tax=Halobacterium salinarum TaxID=2242 RepID=O06022_HALSI|nr:soluble transducer protein HtH [Halobacterium salinarum]